MMIRTLVVVKSLWILIWDCPSATFCGEGSEAFSMFDSWCMKIETFCGEGSEAFSMFDSWSMKIETFPCSHESFDYEEFFTF